MSDDWRKDAACLGVDPDLFFPRCGNNHGLAAAKAVCAGCPVREECLEEHLWEKVGVFGGTSDAERRKLRKGMQRPLPEIDHGTRRGYEQERDRGLDPCRACKIAHAIYRQAQRNPLHVIDGAA